MKLLINKVLCLQGGVLLTSTSFSSWAALTVSFANGFAAQTVTVPITPSTISAGTDAPVGTILYQGNLVVLPSSFSIKWLAADVGKTLHYALSAKISNAPLGTAGLATGPFAGAVYKTGIEGIGVVISLAPNGSPLTPTKTYGGDAQNLLGTELGGTINLVSINRYVSLVKTGPITPGSYSINAANFPTVQTVFDAPQGTYSNSATTSGVPLTYHTINFQGNLTVSTQTCTTPNVAVELGTYDVNRDLHGVNTTSSWKDASITLTNCPRFYGSYNNTNTTLLMDYNTGKSGVTTSLNNSLGVRLTPATSVVDAANGIMAVDSTVSGAASGVGIQLGWGESGQTPTPFNLSGEQSVTLPKDGSSTIRIPLAARYIKTASDPTPGKANGKVMFTINYY